MLSHDNPFTPGEPSPCVAIHPMNGVIDGTTFSHLICIWDADEGIVGGIISAKSWRDALTFAEAVAKITGLPLVDDMFVAIAPEGSA